MQTNTSHLAGVVAYYDPLLTRYASKLLNHHAIAAHIVMRVLERQYEIDQLVPSANLRKNLKEATLKSCNKMKFFMDDFNANHL